MCSGNSVFLIISQLPAFMVQDTVMLIAVLKNESTDSVRTDLQSCWELEQKDSVTMTTIQGRNTFEDYGVWLLRIFLLTASR